LRKETLFSSHRVFRYNVCAELSFRDEEVFGKESQRMHLDAVIFGGGVAGLWLLDELWRRGCSVLLLEAAELGSGQTVVSQGILHGGMKYTLQGLLTPSASAIREMPAVWRNCLEGSQSPVLTGTHIRAEFCYLWRTGSVSSRLGMIGAKFGLRVVPRSVPIQERPSVLKNCPGSVARLEEQVISPAGLIADLSQQHRDRLLKIDAKQGIEFDVEKPGLIRLIRITQPETHQQMELNPRHVIFTAGSGNAELCRQAGLSSDVMQRRPLQMVMLRGELPSLHGHCVDGAKTRVTITSDFDSSQRTVWQVGGQIAEEGVSMEASTLIAHAKSELETVLPGLDLDDVEWATYRVDRAEAITSGGKRPETFQFVRKENTITAWPTKLVLAPKLAEEIAANIEPHTIVDTENVSFAGWPRPNVALPPWETCPRWYQIEENEQKAA
jgi:glycerol-3-phosphate dehydrogenase